MKKNLLFLIAIIAPFAFNSCSEIAENNDPIIGIWSKTINSSTGNDIIKKEWVFNDAYLGRYHCITNNNVAFITDFKWELTGNSYTISYPGTDMENNIVIMKTPSDINNSQESKKNTDAYILEEITNGKTLATRE